MEALCPLCARAVSTLHSHSLPQCKSLTIRHPRHESATRQRCWICCKFSTWLEVEFPHIFQSWRTSTGLDIVYSRDFYQFHAVSWISSRLSLRFCDLDMKPDSTCGVEVDHSCGIRCQFVPFQEYMELAIPSMESRRRSDLSTLDLSLVRSWIEQCTSKHEQCSRYRCTSWYPTRLLELNEDGSSMKLVITNDKQPTGPYMTLSHRWGRAKYRQLTSQTSKDFQQRIDTASLPPAFQEAGKIARKLHVSYLWIDSLCIEQDSDLRDWNREAPKMRQVYGNSFLNLAATLSSDTGTLSLFDTKQWYPFIPMPFIANEVSAKEHKLSTRIRARRSCRKSHQGKVYTIKRFRAFIFPCQYFLVDGSLWEYEVEDTTLSTRAWVYQERLLAPRVLHFGKRQLAWECKEHTAVEMFPKKLPVALAANMLPDIMSAALSSRVDDESHALFLNAWHDLVNRYSKCCLTKLEDKLIALAGVVFRIERARGDQYLAGTWKSTMIYDLPWAAFAGLRKDPSQTLFRAPSWSWLSLEAEILFPKAEKPSGYYAEVLKHPTLEQAGSAVLQAKGDLTLSGVLLPVSNLEFKGDVLNSFCIAGLRFEDGWTPNASHFDLDNLKAERDLVAQQKVFMLPLYYTRSLLLGITLIRCKGSSGKFRRIGAVQIELMRIGSISERAHEGWLVYTQRIEEHSMPLVCHYSISALHLVKIIQEKFESMGQTTITLI